MSAGDNRNYRFYGEPFDHVQEAIYYQKSCVIAMVSFRNLENRVNDKNFLKYL